MSARLTKFTLKRVGKNITSASEECFVQF